MLALFRKRLLINLAYLSPLVTWWVVTGVVTAITKDNTMTTLTH
jgi:hypothetical protein